MTARLALDAVTIALGGRDIVTSVSATAHAGSLVAVTGPNGAGKSTLLRALAGLVAHRGTIRIADRPLASRTPQERARLIGYLPQGHTTHWPLSVREIAGLGRFAHGATDPRRLSSGDRARVDRALAETGLTPLADRQATTLSGGERARLALARVLVQDTPIVLADEPVASLDPRYQIEVMTLLRQMAASGVLVVAVTHDLIHAARFADRVMVLDQGRLVRDDIPASALDAACLATTFGIVAGTPLAEAALPWQLA